MLALLNPIKTRLQGLAPLAGFDVRDGFSLVDRKPLPAADVRMPGAGVGERKGQGVLLSPVWRVTLMVKPGATAVATLDAALSATVAALHGWMPPGEHGGRRWEPLALQSVTEAVFVDEGAIGYQLDFDTSALYRSQNA